MRNSGFIRSALVIICRIVVFCAWIAACLVALGFWQVRIDGEFPPSVGNVLEYIPLVVFLLPLCGILWLLRRRVVASLPKFQMVLTATCMIATGLLYFSLPVHHGWLGATQPWLVLLLISAVPWLAIRWLIALRKTTARARREEVLSMKGKGRLMALPALCLMFALVWWTRSAPRAFDADVWKNAMAGKTTICWRMVDDLLQNHLHLGMTRDEVSGIIGGTSWLKPSWPIPADFTTLYLYFDDNGRLVKAFIHTD